MAVELIADAGAAAVEDEFFRSREFLAAEGVTHTLLASAGGNEAAIPLVVRPIPGSERVDAISPYSYPGGRVTGGPVDRDAIDLAASGLVSAFVRERLGGPAALSGASERSVVLIADPSKPRKSRMSDRQQIRKNEAAGYEVETVAGPEAVAEELTGFLTVYTETMRAVEATDRYFFDRPYFEALLASPLSWLLTVRDPDGACAAAALAVKSDGFLHYYLSGTADAQRRRAPSKNLIAAATDFAESLGLPLNLGGGLRPGDGLEEFKRGFANAELPFRTHELICDPTAYAELSGGRADDGFFPLYRAP
ncbi:MAG: GNAT family N-acetyltransferase [Acidobacteria bacterium]|nr:MAG: GNAT family N-acetyltransferase [Acidobacteriota bacterium]